MSKIGIMEFMTCSSTQEIILFRIRILREANSDLTHRKRISRGCNANFAFIWLAKPKGNTPSVDEKPRSGIAPLFVGVFGAVVMMMNI